MMICINVVSIPFEIKPVTKLYVKGGEGLINKVKKA